MNFLCRSKIVSLSLLLYLSLLNRVFQCAQFFLVSRSLRRVSLTDFNTQQIINILIVFSCLCIDSSATFHFPWKYNPYAMIQHFSNIQPYAILFISAYEKCKITIKYFCKIIDFTKRIASIIYFVYYKISLVLT